MNRFLLILACILIFRLSIYNSVTLLDDNLEVLYQLLMLVVAQLSMKGLLAGAGKGGGVDAKWVNYVPSGWYK